MYELEIVDNLFNDFFPIQAASHDLYNNNQALFTYRVHWLTMTRMGDLPFIEQILGDIDHVSTIIYAEEKSAKIFVKVVCFFA